MRVKILMLIVIFLASASLVKGKEIHVGKGGDFSSIQDAIDAATDGDTVIVSSGTYYENLHIQNKNITLIGEDRQSTIIDGSKKSHTIYVSSCNGIVITGFTIRNAGGAGNDNIIMYDTENATISNNIIKNSDESDGLTLVRCFHVTVSDNVIEDNPSNGILLAHSCNVEITRNLISGNQKGIFLQFSSSNNIVSHNMIKGNTLYGIEIIAASNNNTIFRNTFTNNNVNAYDPCINTWYSTEMHEGNFWDDYKGNDADGDGIGDIPYDVPGGNNVDIYVLGFFEQKPQQNKPPIADVGGPYTGYANQYIQFDGTRSKDFDGYIKSYVWDFGDGTSANGPKVMHRYKEPGNYTVTLTVTDNLGATARDSTIVRVLTFGSNKPPVASSGGPYYGIVGEPVKFDGSSSYDPDGEIISYLWDFGDGEKAFGKIVYHAYDNEGTYNVTLTVTDDKGLYTVDRAIVNVYACANFSINLNEVYVGTVKKGIIFYVYSNESNIVSYSWDFGDGSKVSTEEPMVYHVYNEPGVYNLTVTATNSFGVNSTATAKVIVSELWKKDKFPGFEILFVFVAILTCILIWRRR